MRKIEELRSAAKELVETLGLVDENKDDIVITNKMKEPELVAIIKDAVNEPGLITPDDEFTEETLEIIEEYKDKPKTAGKKKPISAKKEEAEEAEEEAAEEAEEEAAEEEEEEAPPTKKVPAKKTEAPAKKTPVKKEGDEKPKFKHEGSFAAFTDEVILAGGAWDEILPKLEKEIKKRGLKMSANQGLVNNHIKYRVKRDPKWLGSLKITENGIE